MDDPTRSNGAMFPSQARLHHTVMKSVNAETTLAALGITLPAGCIGVEVHNEGSAVLRFDYGSADANKGGISGLGSFPFWETKARLDTLKLYTGSATNVSFFIFTSGND